MSASWNSESLHRAIDIFISYSHEDEELRKEFTTHLAILERLNKIRVWHDRKIQPGAEWNRQIKVNIESAQIILLLVSHNFIASEYCYSIEMQQAICRHNDSKSNATVIPIIPGSNSVCLSWLRQRTPAIE